MASLAAACFATFIMGAVGHHHAACCLAFSPDGLPPPDRPVPLTIVGECRVRDFHRRRWVSGVDANGSIAMTLCQTPNLEGDCCTLTAEGPSVGDDGFTPEPISMSGTFLCETGKSGRFRLNKRQTK
jgi:hypothetical protein